jgi:uncharacterized cysteine cluster protein YcgN (CxxCxxCC family)
MTKDKCLRCGKCCVVWFIIRNNIVYYKDCRYLLKTISSTSCSIYQNRIGKSLGYGNTCYPRAQLNFNIPDCPFNRKGLPTHPVYDPKFKKVKIIPLIGVIK